MKKLFFILTLLISLGVNSQCNTIHTIALPTTAQNPGTTFSSQAGRYVILNVVAGNAYEIESSLATQNFCIREGSYNGSIVSQGGMNGAGIGLVYVAQTTGLAYIHIYTQACATSNTPRDITINNITSNYTTSNSLTHTQGFNSTIIPINNWYAYSVNMGSTAARITGISSGANPTSAPQEGTNYIRFNSYNCSSGSTARLVSPAISTIGTSSVDVEFYWAHDNLFTANDNVQLQFSTNGNTWTNAGTQIQRYSSSANSTATWTKYTITLPSSAGNQSKVYIGFFFTSAWGGNCSLDNVKILPTPPPCTTPTNGGTLSSTKTNTTVNDATTLTTTGNGGTITLLEWSFNNFTSVAGSESNPSNPRTVIMNAQQSQIYFRTTSKDGTCPSGNSNIVTVNLNNATPYVAASGTFGIQDGDYISNVTLGNINNTSTNDGDAYENFKSQIIELTKGEPYSLSVTATRTVNPGQGYSAWIDWNGDGVFQTTENVMQKAPANSASQLINVPSDAFTGDVLMRVLSVWNTTPSTDAYSTTTYRWGEIEEYTVRLSNPISLPVVLTKFDAIPYPQLNIVNWVTASENNSSHFELEMSVDGENWRKLTTIPSAGNSIEELKYSYVNYNSNSLTYYRLQQFDIDGKFETYGPISVTKNNTDKKIVKYINLMGQEVNPENTTGVVIEIYDDGTMRKMIR